MGVRTFLRQIWVADDGKEFINRAEAVTHQRKLQMYGVVRDLAESHADHVIGSIIARFDKIEGAMRVEVGSLPDADAQKTGECNCPSRAHMNPERHAPNCPYRLKADRPDAPGDEPDYGTQAIPGMDDQS